MKTKLFILLAAGLFAGVATQAQGRWEDRRDMAHDRGDIRHDRNDLRHDRHRMRRRG